MRGLSDILTVVLILFFTGQANGQSSTSLSQAKKLYKSEDYQAACKAYSQAISPSFSRENHLLRAGRACYQCGEYARSLNFLEQIRRNEQRYDDEVFYYLALAHHGLNHYEEALTNYKTFLKEAGHRNDLVPAAKLQVLQAWKGSLLKKKDRTALVQNAGEPINTRYSEIQPVPSPTQTNKFYYSKADSNASGGLRNELGQADPLDGHYRYDIYSAELKNGQWTDHHPVDPYLNSNENDVVVDFSDDGQIMYFKKYLNYESLDIVVDTFTTDEKVFRDQGSLSGPWTSEDVSFDLWEDSLLVFSDQREDGFGGRDLYISFRTGGQWSPPRNLGPRINSIHDEDWPFISGDGTQLYFSSNGARSIGGYDILRAEFDVRRGFWRPAENMGHGINSHSDDIGFRISGDGQLGVLSSDRVGGNGGNDIYLVYFNSPVIEQLRIPIFEELKALAVSPKRKPTSVPKETPEKATKNAASNDFALPEFYGISEGFMQDPVNEKKAKKLVKLLNAFPKSKLILNAHSSREKPDAQASFFAAVYARELKSYLVEVGIQSERVIIKSFGKKQPVIKALGPVVSTMETKYNNRITTRVVAHPDEPILPIEYQKLEIEENLRVDDLRSTITGLNYRVEVQTTTQMLNDADLNARTNLIIQQFGEGPYDYMLEGYTTFAEAQAGRNAWVAKGYSSAKVVPYIGEQRIHVGALGSLAEIYPDLLNFISENE